MRVIVLLLLLLLVYTAFARSTDDDNDLTEKTSVFAAHSIQQKYNGIERKNGILTRTNVKRKRQSTLPAESKSKKQIRKHKSLESNVPGRISSKQREAAALSELLTKSAKQLQPIIEQLTDIAKELAVLRKTEAKKLDLTTLELKQQIQRLKTEGLRLREEVK